MWPRTKGVREQWGGWMSKEPRKTSDDGKLEASPRREGKKRNSSMALAGKDLYCLKMTGVG